MKGRMLVVTPLLAVSMMCFAMANGSWLKKVPASDSARINPYQGSSDAAAAGANLFQNNCSGCHGTSAGGKYSRPALRSERLQKATDGQLAWLLKNGEPYKGMPSWGALSDQRRWQLVTFLRSMNPPAAGGQE